MNITVNEKELVAANFRPGDYFLIGREFGDTVRQIVPIHGNGETKYGAFRPDCGEVFHISESIDKLLECYRPKELLRKVVLEDSKLTFKEV